MVVSDGVSGVGVLGGLESSACQQVPPKYTWTSSPSRPDLTRMCLPLTCAAWGGLEQEERWPDLSRLLNKQHGVPSHRLRVTSQLELPQKPGSE